MKMFLKSFWVAAPLLIILWAAVCYAEPGSEPVAKVNDVILTQADLDNAYNEVYPATTFHGGITPEKRVEYRAEAMQILINNELLYQEASRLGVNVEEAVEDAREEAIARFGGKGQYRKALKDAGLTDSGYMAMVRKKLLVEKMRETEIVEKSIVSDDEAREYYKTNKAGFKRPGGWRLRHILVSVDPSSTGEEWEAKKLRAEEALNKIKGGEDMAAVAWDYSDDPYRVKGGDLGIIHSGRLVMELEEAVKKLDVGEVSGVVQTIYGYHIVKVEEKKKPEQLGYEDVETSIKTKLVNKKREQLEEKLMESLKAKASIEVY